MEATTARTPEGRNQRGHWSGFAMFVSWGKPISERRRFAPRAHGARYPVDRRTPQPKVSIVVPALNEAENLTHLLPRLPKRSVELIVVDGNSTDETLGVVQRLWRNPVVVRQQGYGKGGALAAGCATATGQIILTFDADGSADPLEIPRFIRVLLDGADFAKGSRYLAGGGSSDLTPFRSAGNRALTTAVNALFGTSYTDLCYGYNAFWSDCLGSLEITRDGFEVETH